MVFNPLYTHLKRIARIQFIFTNLYRRYPSSNSTIKQSHFSYRHHDCVMLRPKKILARFPHQLCNDHKGCIINWATISAIRCNTLRHYFDSGSICHSWRVTRIVYHYNAFITNKFMIIRLTTKLCHFQTTSGSRLMIIYLMIRIRLTLDIHFQRVMLFIVAKQAVIMVTFKALTSAPTVWFYVT